MTTPVLFRSRAASWGFVAAVLLVWNSLPAWYANPFTLTVGYDGTFYQLLARNRLQGHDELADHHHTVGTEGRHPMWRPGLVWVEEQLARCLGSVQAGSAAASALGVTLMELALLWLARRCFGRTACGLVLLSFFLSLGASVHFLTLAVRQGPEPWAAAGLLAGLAALNEARLRRSWGWAVLAGVALGLAEWFRTGNLLLVAVPGAVYGLAALWQRDWSGCGRLITTGACFLAAVALARVVVPSLVDKTVANLWANLVEHQGIKYTHTFPDGGRVTYDIGGLKLAPGTQETYYDYFVRRSRTVTAREFLAEHSDEVLPLYGERLQDALTGGAAGLRWAVGDTILAFFFGQLLLSLVRPGPVRIHVLALGGAVLAHYLGPVVLLRGNSPTHYLLVASPLIVAVAAQGVLSLTEWTTARLKQRWPTFALPEGRAGWATLIILLAPAWCYTLSGYLGALESLREQDRQAGQEQAALDALDLEGRKVACRNMSWFIDRDIQAVLLPYATVPELARYLRAHHADGILVWDNEPAKFFLATPYGMTPEFDRALRKSPLFEKPRVSGAWRWYPLRRGKPRIRERAAGFIPAVRTAGINPAARPDHGPRPLRLSLFAGGNR
jgi:hypothetical protein